MSSTVIDINRLNASDSDFEDRLATLLQREMIVAEEVTHTVSDILQEVRSRGDSAVVEYTKRFDGFAANSIDELSVSQEQMLHALQSISKEQREALTHAADRIRSYHEKQKQDSWTYTETDGSVYGQKISPLRRVGVYVPGGKANYPSSMLMLAIPAQVAGVKEIIATVPTAYS